MSVTAGVLSNVALATREKLRGGIVQTKVKRYWPGKAPDWAEEAEEEDDHEDVRMHKEVDVLDRASPRHDDPRLHRLAQTRIENLQEVRGDHRRVRQAAEIISTEEEQEEEELRNQETREDEDALEERRRRIRERYLERAQEEAALLPVEEEEEEEEEEESEYETDSEDEMPGIIMFNPVLVTKAERYTVAERERLEAKEEALEELAKRKLEIRKIETKHIVVEEVRKDKNMLLEEADIGDVETDDEINEAEEYEVWKTREIARINRERDAKEALLREREEIDKLRNMTEQERRDWERKNPKPSTAQHKRKWKFMQRYYHKGAFFHEAGPVGTDGIFQRDFSAPTGEDRLDKSKLHKVMQVKHFGRSGRTKWTHLVNEDTTYWRCNPWTSSDPLREK